jgi:hypothetical protein
MSVPFRIKSADNRRAVRTANDDRLILSERELGLQNWNVRSCSARFVSCRSSREFERATLQSAPSRFLLHSVYRKGQAVYSYPSFTFLIRMNSPDLHSLVA